MVRTWWLDPCGTPQGVIVRHPVPMLHITTVANNLHPLWVLVENLPGSCGPLLSQTADIQALIFHCQPLRFKSFIMTV